MPRRKVLLDRTGPRSAHPPRAPAAGLLFALAVGGCGAAEEAAPDAGGFKVLSKPASAVPREAVLPDPSIWTTPQSDPLLEEGRLVWTGTCIECHSTGLGGAPLIGNRELSSIHCSSRKFMRRFEVGGTRGQWHVHGSMQ